MSKKLGIALGGGGMKGLAHVGALSVIDALGLKPNLIAGTSMGALVGAFYAAMFPIETIQRLFAEPLGKLISPRLDGKGLINVQGLRDFLYQKLPYHTFEALPIPLQVICTDIETSEEVCLSSGDLIEAILASTCVPGVFAPVKIGNRLLIDGGLTNNLPVSKLIEAHMDVTIGIRLFSKERWSFTNPEENAADNSEDVPWKQYLSEKIFQFAPPGFRVLERSIEVLIDQLENLQLTLHPPDILIDPDVSDISILNFFEARDPIFERGRVAALLFEQRLKALAHELQR